MIVYIVACLSSLFSLLLHPVQQDLPTTPLEVALFPLPGYRIQPYHTILCYDLVILAMPTWAPGGCRLHPFWFPPAQSPVVLMLCDDYTLAVSSPAPTTLRDFS